MLRLAHVLPVLAFVAAIGCAGSPPARAPAAASPASLRVVAESPWLCNGVTVTRSGKIFLGLPRFPGHEETPGLGVVDAAGHVVPFPGGAWNGWHPGQSGAEAFVNVNSVHVFADGTLWAVDQGAFGGGTPGPGAQKLVQLDPETGRVLGVLRFGADMLPPGATMNDLRVHGHTLYVTDSGLGGILVHDLARGTTMRRLSKHPSLRQPEPLAMKGFGGRMLDDAKGKRPAVHSDMLEVTADGTFLYWSAPTGPLLRIRTDALLDPNLDDASLAGRIETIASIATIGGTAIDTHGNILLSDGEHRRIDVLTPEGALATLASDPRLVSPDAIFLGEDRRLYVPASQIELVPPHHGGTDATTKPFLVLSMPLPASLEGHPLGNAVTGAPAPGE